MISPHEEGCIRYTQWMTSCPICQRPTLKLVHNPYVQGKALELTLKIESSWKREDGMCPRCVESIVNTASELEDYATQERPSAIGFNSHYRYTLTKREHGQWHHISPDMQRWRQREIVDKVSDEAMAAGFDC